MKDGFATWDKGSFNEKKPFGGMTVFNDDSEKNDRYCAQQRYEAMKAHREGRATMEQLKLLKDADEAINDCLNKRGKS